MTPIKFRTFLALKLPIAYISGLKLHSFTKKECVIRVKYSWWNQNPFKSMFWAVQGMGAELSTGLLCITEIQKSKQKISMLVIKQEALFTKKAVGKILFTCKDGELVEKAIKNAIKTQQGQTIVLKSIGTDEKKNVVSEFAFTWSFKVKS